MNLSSLVAVYYIVALGFFFLIGWVVGILDKKLISISGLIILGIFFNFWLSSILAGFLMWEISDDIGNPNYAYIFISLIFFASTLFIFYRALKWGTSYRNKHYKIKSGLTLKTKKEAVVVILIILSACAVIYNVLT